MFELKVEEELGQSIFFQYDDNGAYIGKRFQTKSAAEIANQMTIINQAINAMVTNTTFYQTPNANLTNADVVNEVKALARQVNGILRVLIDKFDGTN